MTVALFLLCLGATARITRLFTDDFITRHIRVWLINRLGPEHDLPYLISCPFCLSMYVAGAVYTTGYFFGHSAAFVIVASALSASWLVGHVASFLDAQEG